MKKYLFILSLSLIICTIAEAQSKFSLGPSIGLGYTTIRNTSASNGKIAANLGAALIYQVKENFGIGLDVQYSLIGEKTTLNRIAYNRDLQYLRLPIKAIYHFKKIERFTPKVFTGPSFGFLVSGKTELQTEDKNAPVLISNDSYKSFDFGITTGAGVLYKLDEKISLDGDFSYYHGLSAVIQGSKARNRNMMLTLGVNFQL